MSPFQLTLDNNKDRKIKGIKLELRSASWEILSFQRLILLMSARVEVVAKSLFMFFFSLQVWAGWVYREGIRADDRTDQINYSDSKCQPGKTLSV